MFVSLVALYFPLMTDSCIIGIVRLYVVSNFFSAFNALSYTDVYVLASFLWYVNSDDFFLFRLTLSSSSGMTYTGSLFSGSDVGILSSSTWRQIFFVKISKHLQDFRLVYHLQPSPLNIPCHDYPIGIRIVQFVRISCVIIYLPNHNGIVRLIPLSDVF